LPFFNDFLFFTTISSAAVYNQELTIPVLFGRNRDIYGILTSEDASYLPLYGGEKLKEVLIGDRTHGCTTWEEGGDRWRQY